MNPSTSEEKIIEIAKSLFKHRREKTLSIHARFEPEDILELDENVKDTWIVVFEIDYLDEINFVIVYIHDKTHETTILPTM
jgi:hypothetical protein